MCDLQAELVCQVSGAGHFGQIDCGHVDVGGAPPISPFARMQRQEGRTEHALHGDPPCQSAFRCGVKPDQVLSPRVAHHQVHLFQCDGGLLLEVIGPADGAGADGELRLGKKPVHDG